jgi:hypothetical protein
MRGNSLNLFAPARRPFFEGDLAFDFAGEVAGDFDDAGAPEANLFGGAAEVFGLLFDDGLHSGPDVLVIGAAFVGDEDDFFQAVLADEEGELALEGIFFVEAFDVAGEAGGSAGDGHAVVAGKVEGGVEEFVHLLAEATIAAIDGGGGDAVGFEGVGADEDGAVGGGFGGDGGHINFGMIVRSILAANIGNGSIWSAVVNLEFPHGGAVRLSSPKSVGVLGAN